MRARVAHYVARGEDRAPVLLFDPYQPPLITFSPQRASCLRLPDDAHAVGKCIVRSIIKAGEVLRVKCPLDAEYKVGRNWAETH